MIMALYFGILAAIYGASVLPRRWRIAAFISFTLLSLLLNITDRIGGAQ
ncbi:MAG: hypothetical protein ABFC56_14135 [Clostridiaceae bacterium]